MATYYTNEGAFELRELGFEDRTVHLLEATHPDHGALALVVHRAPFPEGKSLRELVAAHVLRETTHHQGYAVLEEWDRERAGLPAIEVASRFRDEGGVYYQVQTHLALPTTWMYFALSAPLESRAACDGWSEQILRSLRLRATP